MNTQIIIFTDLDGTLLDTKTFKFDQISQYVKYLISIGVMIIPNSSKTEDEILDFIDELGVNLSFISENGSAIHNLDLINKNLPKKIILSRNKDEIFKIFKEKISLKYQSKLQLISNLSLNEKLEIFGLPRSKLDLSMNRNYTIPLKFLGNIEDKENIINNLMKIGLRIQEGGRIMNLGDNITKGTAMTKTLHLIKSNFKKDVKTIGVGDNFNDLEMIKKSDFPCLVKSDNFEYKNLNINNLIISNKPSPMGWADVIKIVMEKIN